MESETAGKDNEYVDNIVESILTNKEPKDKKSKSVYDKFKTGDFFNFSTQVELLSSKTETNPGIQIPIVVLLYLRVVFEALKRDWDYIMLEDGMEGAGKSRFIKEVVGETWHYITGTPFTIDNIVFTVDEFLEKAKTLPQYSLIIWDESIFGATGQKALTLDGQALRELLSTIRKRNLFAIFIMPRFDEFAPYIGKTRGRVLFRVKGNLIRRGLLDIYLPRSKRVLYEVEKRNLHIWFAEPDYKNVKFKIFKQYGRKPMIDDAEYEKKKDESIAKIKEQMEEELADVENHNIGGFKVGTLLKVLEGFLEYSFKVQRLKPNSVAKLIGVEGHVLDKITTHYKSPRWNEEPLLSRNEFEEDKTITKNKKYVKESEVLY